jgi:putative transposase
MKQVTDTLGLARSNIAERVKGVRPKRGPQTRDGDRELAADIRRLVDARPTYGYRRIAALLKRKRRADGRAPVNAKRIYRLMKKHGLLLARHTGRRRPREHDGQVATLRSNIRWCSDGLEFTPAFAGAGSAGTARSPASPSRLIATTARSSAGSPPPPASPAR